MQELMIDILNQYGYLGIFLLVLIESVFPPIPSEIILTFGGFLTTCTDMNVWIVVVISSIASLIGSIALYVVGRIFHVQRLEAFCDSKYGKFLHLKKQDIHKAGNWFLKHENRAVFFCRFVPIVRSLISIPAGIAKMNISSFIALSALGNFIWNMALVFLGRTAGDAWETVNKYLDIYALAAAAFFLLIALIVGVIFIKKRFLSQKTNEDASSDTSLDEDIEHK